MTLSLKLLLVFINAVSCCVDKNYYFESGFISVENYGRSVSCNHKIRLTDKSRWIKLEWKTFNVDGNMPSCKDFVQIYTG